MTDLEQDVTHTLNDYLSIIVPVYIDSLKHTLDICQTYTTRIKNDANITLEADGNIFVHEQNYHCKGDHDIALDDDQSLEVFEFNEYVPGYKLLTQRTQQYLFAKCMLSHFPHDPSETNDLAPITLQKTITKLCQAGLVDWLRHCVLTHPDVESFMQPIAARYETFVAHEIERLDAIPHVEQKTEAWHQIRKNMISASIAGYIDSAACGCNKSNERSKIEEKGGVKDTRPFSWGCIPLRHGQQYEDVTGHIYNTFKRLNSKEYGILPDYRYNWLGASPDGVITSVSAPNTNRRAQNATSEHIDSTSYMDKAMLGRMREIKNPVSRSINDKIPSYYYWQMLQQMYVCQLPICDFIQTQFKYPIECDFQTYINDTIPPELITNANCWQDHHSYLAPYIIENIDWSIMNLFLIKDFKLTDSPINDRSILQHIGKIDLNNIDNMLATTLARRFYQVTHIAPENINKRGQAKGMLWCFIKDDDNGETEFRVEFTQIHTPANNKDDLHQHECMLRAKYLADGFTLSEQHYWNLEEYKVTEVEYNQGLYEGLAQFCNHPNITPDNYHKDNCIINRLLTRWNIIQELRSIEDTDAKRAKFLEYYPNEKKNNTSAATNSQSKDNNKTALGNSKYTRRPKSSKPRQHTVFNLD